MEDKINVAIFGTGNIGTDLLMKSLRSPFLRVTGFVGRNLASAGMAKAQGIGVPVSAQSMDFFINNPKVADVVFDCTSAKDHIENAATFRKLGIRVIDLTPAKVGPMCVPAVNVKECLQSLNVNMVTCGGQASIPVAYVMGQTQSNVDYIEVVSSIASRSAGPATRINLDEYIHTTEEGVKTFSGARRTKAILNLNPAVPCINMQTTIFCKTENPNIESLKHALQDMEKRIQTYVPGYQVIVGPTLENGRIVVMVRVRGLGDYLPEYAGNLDIINCAAIGMAEEYAKNWSQLSQTKSSGARYETRFNQ